MTDTDNLIAEAKRWPEGDGPKPSASPADLIARLVAALEAVQPVTPDRRTVSTREELDALPRESVVLNEHAKFGGSRVYRKVNSESWVCDMFVGYSGPVPLPALVIFNPADALLASGVLGQPQPQPDRADIKDLIDDLRESAAQSYDELSQVTIDTLNRAINALLPLLGQPRTDAPLDPEPWVVTGTTTRTAFPRMYGLMTHWEPEPQFEQDQARYPRTDEEDGR